MNSIDNTTQQALDSFQHFDIDTKLALLWHGYLDIKDQLKPTTNPSVQNLGSAVFDQIKALPKQEQLQAQRDLLSGANNAIVRAYDALSSNARLDVWLRLAQGMEKGTIIPVPSDYKLPDETNSFVNQVKGLDFEQRVNFMLNAVAAKGTTSARQPSAR
jgi:hypothetical protein